MSATPRPWLRDNNNEISSAKTGQRIAIVGTAANASLIVRAVNAHDDLVAALEAQLAAPFSTQAHDSGNGVTHRWVGDGAKTGCQKCVADVRARSALAKAGAA